MGLFENDYIGDANPGYVIYIQFQVLSSIYWIWLVITIQNKSYL
jgi:hypothetical protein